MEKIHVKETVEVNRFLINDIVVYFTIINYLILGPLTVTDSNGVTTLVGVTSWGFGCGLAFTPGVYAEVATVLSWIQGNSNAGSCS